MTISLLFLPCLDLVGVAKANQAIIRHCTVYLYRQKANDQLCLYKKGGYNCNSPTTLANVTSLDPPVLQFDYL